MASIPPLIEQNDASLLSWLDSAIRSGLSLLKREQAYQNVAESIAYLNGAQGGGPRPSALSRVTFNRLRKIVYEIVSSMTDVRPIWNYQTYNNQFKQQADILNKLVRNWWRNSYADRRMQDALMYSCAGGSGYLKVEWNPWLPGGGNIDLIPLDPRDVIPINPAFNTSPQQWQGVAIRKTVSLPSLRTRYPEKFYKYKAQTKGWFDPKVSVGGGGGMEIISPVLDKLFSGRDPVSAAGSDVDLIHVFVRDDSMNTGLEPKLMGRPGTNWCYEVYPLGSTNPKTGKVVTEAEAKLYPRGRLIICTPECILEDIPNPYWHGMFPLIKFTLDPQPWSILGSSLVADGRSIQESLNEVLRGVEDAVKQWLRRTVVGNSNAIGKGLLNKIDSRMAGQKILLNPSAGDGLKFIEGPQLPEYIMKYAQFLIDALDDNSGVKGLRELAQLKQMPSADTIEKFLDAQSPLLRLRSAQMEQSLAELAEMVKVMIFQYYDAPRRLQILGPDGISMEDFDYDPRMLVPALTPMDDGYKPEYDAMLTTRSQRAEKHHQNFAFSVARNSFLNASHTQQKMFYLQLARMPTPMIDPWTLLEALDVPNIGPIPDGSVFDRIHLAQQVGLLPPSPQMAAMMGGPPGGGGKPPGRPPSGNEPPQMVQRNDGQGGQRQVVSESGR